MDVQVMPDGSLLVYDDYAGRIYRISYGATKQRSPGAYNPSRGKEEPSAMIKVKTFTSQMKIFHTRQELDELDKEVNDFIASGGIRKVISISDASTAGDKGESIGLIRVLTYEEPAAGHREIYQEKVETTLQEWGREIESLRKKADKLGTEAKARYREQIKDLHARQEAAGKKLEELKRSGGEAWEDLRKGADKALDELKKDVEDAIAKMKRK